MQNKTENNVKLFKKNTQMMQKYLKQHKITQKKHKNMQNKNIKLYIIMQKNTQYYAKIPKIAQNNTK